MINIREEISSDKEYAHSRAILAQPIIFLGDKPPNVHAL